MLVPMAVYFLVNLSFGATGCMSALTVPMATDIAFAGTKQKGGGGGKLKKKSSIVALCNK
jgi:hypothetical protein